MTLRNATTPDLFKTAALATQQPIGQCESLAPGASYLRGFALENAPALLAAVEQVLATAPFRHMSTPGGLRMSVAMTNCGDFGWLSDRRGYRYDRKDPLTGKPWPAFPDVFVGLARSAAELAGYANFVPDACLINCYAPGTRLSLHQDKDERDFDAPIVSVSLGLPATFLFGGEARSDRQQRISLQHGDVVVWGGRARLRFHGVLTLKDGHHDLIGAQRINLTLRKAR